MMLQLHFSWSLNGSRLALPAQCHSGTPRPAAGYMGACSDHTQGLPVLAGAGHASAGRLVLLPPTWEHAVISHISFLCRLGQARANPSPLHPPAVVSSARAPHRRSLARATREGVFSATHQPAETCSASRVPQQGATCLAAALRPLELAGTCSASRRASPHPLGPASSTAVEGHLEEGTCSASRSSNNSSRSSSSKMLWPSKPLVMSQHQSQRLSCCVYHQMECLLKKGVARLLVLICGASGLV